MAECHFTKWLTVSKQCSHIWTGPHPRRVSWLRNAEQGGVGYWAGLDVRPCQIFGTAPKPREIAPKEEITTFNCRVLLLDTFHKGWLIKTKHLTCHICRHIKPHLEENNTVGNKERRQPKFRLNNKSEIWILYLCHRLERMTNTGAEFKETPIFFVASRYRKQHNVSIQTAHTSHALNYTAHHVFRRASDRRQLEKLHHF